MCEFGELGEDHLEAVEVPFVEEVEFELELEEVEVEGGDGVVEEVGEVVDVLDGLVDARRVGGDALTS